MTSHQQRLSHLRQAMDKEGLDGFIVLDRADTFYITGFTGTSSILIIMTDVALFMTDSRYFEYAAKILPVEFDVILQKGDGRNQIKGFFDVRGKRHLGFEPSIPYEKYRWLSGAVRPARLLEKGRVLKSLRLIKDPGEIKMISRAASLADRCMQMIFSEIKPGLTERDVAIKIRRFFEDTGAEAESFPIIVASGPNSALPHHHTSGRN